MMQPPRLDPIGTQADSHRRDHGDVPSVSAPHAWRWLAPMAAQAVWRRFRQDSRAIPSAVWRAWLAAISVGFVLTLILSVGLVFLGQSLKGHGLETWDMQALRWVAARGPLTFANAIT